MPEGDEVGLTPAVPRARFAALARRTAKVATVLLMLVLVYGSLLTAMVGGAEAGRLPATSAAAAWFVMLAPIVAALAVAILNRARERSGVALAAVSAVIASEIALVTLINTG